MDRKTTTILPQDHTTRRSYKREVVTRKELGVETTVKNGLCKVAAKQDYTDQNQSGVLYRYTPLQYNLVQTEENRSLKSEQRRDKTLRDKSAKAVQQPASMCERAEGKIKIEEVLSATCVQRAM